MPGRVDRASQEEQEPVRSPFKMAAFFPPPPPTMSLTCQVPEDWAEPTEYVFLMVNGRRTTQGRCEVQSGRYR